MAKLRVIENHPMYLVSIDGAIISLKSGSPKMLFISTDKAGYCHVGIEGKTYLVHRLVAKSFVKGSGKTVNHIDGDKSNNSAYNLEWCSQWENHLHAMRLGLHSKPERPIIGVNESTGEGIWIRSLRHALKVGFNPKVISRVLRGDYPRHKGYAWFHADNVLGEVS